jgi:hypothetical protein
MDDHMTASPDLHELCPECKRVDFRQIFDTAYDEIESYSFQRPLQAVQANRNCPSCLLVLKPSVREPAFASLFTCAYKILPHIDVEEFGSYRVHNGLNRRCKNRIKLPVSALLEGQIAPEGCKSYIQLLRTPSERLHTDEECWLRGGRVNWQPNLNLVRS